MEQHEIYDNKGNSNSSNSSSGYGHNNHDDDDDDDDNDNEGGGGDIEMGKNGEELKVKWQRLVNVTLYEFGP